MDEPLIFPGTVEGALDPREHDQLIGQDNPRHLFESAAQSARMPHAWILQGPMGIGKASFAWHYARQLAHFGQITNTPLPDDVMARFARGSQSMIYDIAPPSDDKGGFKAQIPIESIRQLNEKLSYRQDAQNWRVVIIDPAESMNNNAANALLKLLEEPPEQVVFFLITHAPHRLLPTILSRCQKLRFQELTNAQMREIWPHVTSEAVPDDTHFELAEGSMRMALSQNEDFTESYAQMVSMIKAPIARAQMLQITKRLQNNDRSLAFENAKTLFQLLFGRLLRVDTGLEAGTPTEQSAAAQISSIKSNWSALSQEVQAQIDQAQRLNLDFEVTILEIWFSIDKLLRAS